VKRYRLYLIDLDRRVYRAEDLPCRSDALAIVAAEARRGESAAELWMGGRRVKVYEARYPATLTTALAKPARRRRSSRTPKIGRIPVAKGRPGLE
jgi:hypothetical protein